MTIRASRPARDEQAAAGYHREVVASFSSYHEAERAVDFLAGQRFPDGRIAIVGQGLRLVHGERRRRRLDRVLEPALAGAVVGALFTLLAALSGLGGGVADMSLAALTFGAACGTLAGLGAERVAADRRPPEPEVRLFADRYDVAVDPAIAEEAARAFDDGQTGPSPTPAYPAS
jgi:hypothetical protein